MAKTATSSKPRTRRPGKESEGWEKIGLLLAPETFKRLNLASIHQQSDRSKIVNDLLLKHLPTYVLSIRSGPGASSTSVDPTAEPNLPVTNPA